MHGLGCSGHVLHCPQGGGGHVVHSSQVGGGHVLQTLFSKPSDGGGDVAPTVSLYCFLFFLFRSSMGDRRRSRVVGMQALQERQVTLQSVKKQSELLLSKFSRAHSEL